MAWIASGQPAAVARLMISTSSSKPVITTPEPSSIAAVPEPSDPSMNIFRYPRRNQSSPTPARTPSSSSIPSRSTGSDCHTRIVSVPCSWRRCHIRGAPIQPSLSWTAVTPRRVGDGDALGHGGDVLVVADDDVAAERPRRLLTEVPGGLSVVVPGHDPARGGRGPPARPSPAPPCSATSEWSSRDHSAVRMVPGHRVEVVAAGLHRVVPVAVPPAVPDQPSTRVGTLGRHPDPRDGLG